VWLLPRRRFVMSSSVWTWLCVSLSAIGSLSTELHVRSLPILLVIIQMVVARSCSCGVAMLCTCGFMSDIMMARNKWRKMSMYSKWLNVDSKDLTPRRVFKLNHQGQHSVGIWYLRLPCYLLMCNGVCTFRSTLNARHLEGHGVHQHLIPSYHCGTV